MQFNSSAKAIVLSRQTFREYDCRISLYSFDYGRLDLVVRGAKKAKSKLAGHIEPITEINLMIIKGRQYNYLGSALTSNSFFRLKNDYNLLLNGALVIRMVNKIIKQGEIDIRMYYLIYEYLQALNSRNVSKYLVDLFLFYFLLKFIFYLGYYPHFDSCMVCGKRGKKIKYFFDYEQGGVICEFCKKNKKLNLLISVEAIDLMKKILNSKIEEMININIDDKLLEKLKKILVNYIKYNLNYRVF